mgnify:CR=1 FL=1
MIDIGLVAFIAAVAGGFGAFLALGWKLESGDPAVEKVIDAIVANFLDERRFSVSDMERAVDLHRDAIKKALKRLERAGIVMKQDGGWYRIKDPLVFLTERDYERAVRITKDDNILYGAYQNPYMPRLYLLLVYLIVAIDIAFAILAYLSYTIGWPSPALADWVINILPRKDEHLLVPFLLFLLGMGVIFVDFIDNIIKALARERYSVVVGEKSGISYDKSLADELSGNIRRGWIRNVDLDITLFQKIINYFRSVPLGDVKVEYEIRGKKDVEVFKNMPFPRELFYVIRSIQLGSLGWRKRHAKTLLYWRSRGMPVVAS